MGDRIVNLPEEEWGWIKITSPRRQGQAEFNTVGTIGWLTLPKVLAPGKKVRIHLEWDAGCRDRFAGPVDEQGGRGIQHDPMVPQAL